HDDYSWPFNGIVPVIIPWKSERIFAQRGTFTIHGRDTRPLEEQLRPLVHGEQSPHDGILGRVQLSTAASLYAVRHVVQFIGLDQFTMFRGEDDLGRDARERTT
ncbi:MAG TPA: hypothetical protein VIH92_02420, partial [Solirubrobacteraceae bacterium]